MPDRPLESRGNAPVSFQCMLLGSGEIQQYYLRTILHSFENDFLAVWRQIKVANVEVGRQVGQLLFSASLQVDKPKILVLDLSTQNYKC